MLTIICGEDNVSSRDYFISLKKTYSDKGYEVRDITSSEILEINRWMSESPSLFIQKRIFFIENINKKLSRKLNLKFTKLFEELIADKNTQIITWEDQISSRELKISKGATIKEFKLSQSIFKLLDICYPRNLKLFVKLLNELPPKIDESFIFIMLTRQIRNLLTVKTGETNKKLQSWQVYKLKAQARHWELKSLISFYDGLHRIDVSSKTSKNPFSIKKSLEILACYFL